MGDGHRTNNRSVVTIALAHFDTRGCGCFGSLPTVVQGGCFQGTPRASKAPNPQPWTLPSVATPLLVLSQPAQVLQLAARHHLLHQNLQAGGLPGRCQATFAPTRPVQLLLSSGRLMQPPQSPLPDMMQQDEEAEAQLLHVSDAQLAGHLAAK